MSGEELEGDDAFEPGVLGFVDDTHAAFPEFFEDLVVADVEADHLDVLPTIAENFMRTRQR